MGYAINAKLAGSGGSACCCTPPADCCLYPASQYGDSLTSDDLPTGLALFFQDETTSASRSGNVYTFETPTIYGDITVTDGSIILSKYNKDDHTLICQEVPINGCLIDEYTGCFYGDATADLFPDVYNLSGYPYSSTITRVSKCKWEFDNGEFGTDGYRYIAVYWDRGIDSSHPIGSGWTMEVRFGHDPDAYPYYFYNLAYNPGPQSSPANTYINDPVFTITVSP